MKTLTNEQMETALIAITGHLTKEEILHEVVNIITKQELKQLITNFVNYEPPLDEKVSEFISCGAIGELHQLERTNAETRWKSNRILNNLSKELDSTTEVEKQQIND